MAWLVYFPLFGFLINGFWYALGQAPVGRKKASAQVTGAIASTAIGASFLLGLALFFQLTSLPAEERFFEQTLFSWIHVPGLAIDFKFRLDALSGLFVLVITGVGTLIHLYSIGYMSHDETPGKFFSYLNLFCAAMLILVLGSSLPVTFLGWEGVGLCSYLLIGYWYEDIEKASAGKKAFVVNRIGDLGFLLGMFMLYSLCGSLEYTQIQSQIGSVHSGAITAACLLLFLGCTGKSAQIPLYVWLPDAMAGPTPVSALIHAATMVTSGVYLCARLSHVFLLAPMALEVMAWTGALTALFAATMALAQDDIKKVLAYSTVSQLGYMFLACGVGAFTTGVFHVMTHAFFKALMFLGAGSVIYGMHHEQDLQKMGGLRSQMPKTFLVFMVGWLAICGIPPFSGFFSKDEILWQAMSSEHGSSALWLLGALTAVLTAFYMTRLIVLAFYGESRSEHHAHESPSIMTVPLMVLAGLSALGGFLGVPHMSWLEHWLEPVVASAHHNEAVAHSTEWLLMAVSVAGAALGIFGAFRLYSNLKNVSAIQLKWKNLYRVLAQKWYVDELYEWVIVKPLNYFSQFLWKVIDVSIIDRIVLTFGKASQWAGQNARMIQTGSVQSYGVLILLGLVLTMGYLLYVVS